MTREEIIKLYPKKPTKLLILNLLSLITLVIQSIIAFRGPLVYWKLVIVGTTLILTCMSLKLYRKQKAVFEIQRDYWEKLYFAPYVNDLPFEELKIKNIVIHEDGTFDAEVEGTRKVDKLSNVRSSFRVLSDNSKETFVKAKYVKSIKECNVDSGYYSIELYVKESDIS